ncbi:MAG: hypothetical protein WA810_00080 [Maribacter sp.]
MKRLFNALRGSGCIVLLYIASLSSCAVTESRHTREYTKVWRKLIKTKAWQESLMANNAVSEAEIYATIDSDRFDGIVLKSTTRFDAKYQSLVSRAYFKIITEAEKADARISAEYKLLQTWKLNFKADQRKITEITRKYEAHRAMLNGLKSWNIFGDNRTGDLDYFKKENEDAIQRMIGEGVTNDQIVNYLIYKLADVYHGEEN